MQEHDEGFRPVLYYSRICSVAATQDMI